MVIINPQHTLCHTPLPKNISIVTKLCEKVSDKAPFPMMRYMNYLLTYCNFATGCKYLQKVCESVCRVVDNWLPNTTRVYLR